MFASLLSQKFININTNIKIQKKFKKNKINKQFKNENKAQQVIKKIKITFMIQHLKELYIKTNNNNSVSI